MNKKIMVAGLALGAVFLLCPPQGAFAQKIGGLFDNAIYAGMSPDKNGPFSTTLDDAPDSYNWEGGDKYCSDLVALGHDDWRLPTIGELNTLYTFRKKGALAGSFRKTDNGTGVDWYWSSTQDGGQAMIKRFSTGEESQDYLSAKASVRCVRG